jgi:hypothetical protein
MRGGDGQHSRRRLSTDAQLSIIPLYMYMCSIFTMPSIVLLASNNMISHGENHQIVGTDGRDGIDPRLQKRYNITERKRQYQAISLTIGR